MSIHARIKELRLQSGLSQEEFATSVGLKRANYAQIELGKQNPTIDTLTAIVRNYNKSYNWVIDGSEEIAPKIAPNVAPNDKKLIKSGDSNLPKIVTVDHNKKENIVFVPVKAAAGYLNGYGDPEFIESLQSYRLPGFESGTFRMFEVNGNSMVPTLKNRDRIVTKWADINDIKDSYVHVIVTKTDGVVVKRVLNRVKKDGVLILKSDGNSYEYPDLIVDAEDVLECWLGLGKISRDLSGPNDLYSRLDEVEGRITMLSSLEKRLKELERSLKGS